MRRARLLPSPAASFAHLLRHTSVRARATAQVRWAVSNFGGRSAYKMLVYDADYRAALLAEAEPAMLPAQLGGALPEASFAAGK